MRDLLTGLQRVAIASRAEIENDDGDGLSGDRSPRPEPPPSGSELIAMKAPSTAENQRDETDAR